MCAAGYSCGCLREPSRSTSAAARGEGSGGCRACRAGHRCARRRRGRCPDDSTVMPVSITTRISAITASAPVASRSARWRGMRAERPWARIAGLAPVARRSRALPKPRLGVLAAVHAHSSSAAERQEKAGTALDRAEPAIRTDVIGDRDRLDAIAARPRARRALQCARWRTRGGRSWPGIVAQHADRCDVRDGGACDCGPVGYRASVEDPESGEPVLSPTLETLAEARAWRHEQREAFEAWQAASEERPSVDAVIRGPARGRGARQRPRPIRAALRHGRPARTALGADRTRTRGARFDGRSPRCARATCRRWSTGSTRAGCRSGASMRSCTPCAVAVRLRARSAIPHRVEPGRGLALPDEEPVPDPPAPQRVDSHPTVAVSSGTADTRVAEPPSVSVGMIPEQVIWTCLKAVTLMFVLIALVLVAESV